MSRDGASVAGAWSLARPSRASGSPAPLWEPRTRRLQLCVPGVPGRGTRGCGWGLQGLCGEEKPATVLLSWESQGLRRAEQGAVQALEAPQNPTFVSLDSTADHLRCVQKGM